MPVQTIYIDVDNTLIDKEGNLLPGVEAVLKQWRRMYGTVVVWSHTGGAYARKTCKQHKLDKYVDYFLDKPDIIVDDNHEMLMRYAHVLKVVGNDWWQRAMEDLFKDGATVKPRSENE